MRSWPYQHVHVIDAGPASSAILFWVAVASLPLLALGMVGEPGYDSAAFSCMARELQDGAVLYRDIWDNKQPGIYWFHRFVGFLTILRQRFSWWTYCFEMLIWPFRLLAAFGVATPREPVFRAARRPLGVRARRLAAACVALFLAVQTVHAVRKRFDPDWPIPANLRSAIEYARHVVASAESAGARVFCGTWWRRDRTAVACSKRQPFVPP